MGDEVAWTAVAAAAITAAIGAYNTWQNRLSKRDQMQNDSRLLELEFQNKKCDESWKRVSGELQDTKKTLHETSVELANCREQHKASEQRHAESEKDREDMRRKIDKLQEVIARREDRIRNNEADYGRGGG